MKALGSKVSA